MSYDLYSPVSTQPSPFMPPPEALLTGWHSPNQIHTFAGLGGTYNWPEGGSMMTMVFAPNAGVVPPPGMGFTPGGGGFYILTSMGINYTGQYSTRLPSSGFPPAIRLSGFGGRQYDVQGMFTSPGETVSFLFLRSPTGMFFLPYRTA